ncbi:hypothetical protein FQN50_004334 [Emmonsiellopsis sp. PD_5]|nr:hypothetical protein FQN50_004334 [Emmonsiellopsis sp. PD_5]
MSSVVQDKNGHDHRPNGNALISTIISDNQQDDNGKILVPTAISWQESVVGLNTLRPEEGVRKFVNISHAVKCARESLDELL